MARISTAFDEIGKARAETIANTETAAAFNYARDKAMREAGVTHKRWLHSQSPLIKEPRPTHLEADGQVVPIDDPFDVGGVQFMRPADDSLGAGPEDIINCHCVAIPVEAPLKSRVMRIWDEFKVQCQGEAVGHPFRGNQYTHGLTGEKYAPKTVKQFKDYTLVHEPHPTNPNDLFKGGDFIRAYDKQGKEAGNLYYGKLNKRDTFLDAAVDVKPEHRRHGLATEMFNMAEGITGLKFQPSYPRTALGTEFMKSRE